MAADWILTTVHAMSFVVVCIHVIACVRRIGFGALVQKMKGAPHFLMSTLRWFQRKSEAGNDEDSITLLVQKHMEAEVVKSMRTLSNYFAHLYALFVVAALMNIYQKSARWMTPGQDAVQLIAACLHILLHLFPSLIRPGTVRIVYFCQMITTSGYMIFLGGGAHFGAFATLNCVWTLRIAYSLAYLDQVATTFANVLGSAVSCMIYMVVLHRDLRMFLIFEVAICILVIIVARSVWRSRASTVRQEITATTLKGESSTLTALLNLMCDVVVELDGDLCIAEDSPKLSAFLTLGGRTKSLKASKLQDFMPLDEDKQRFEQRLLEPVGSEDSKANSADFLPGALPVQMRDSLGNSLSMELFYAQCNGLGQRRFFIGLRETSEESIGSLKVFQKSKKRRASRRSAVVPDHAKTAQAEAEGFSDPVQVGSASGSSNSDQDSVGSDSGDDGPGTPRSGRLMNPSWQPITEKGKKVVVLQALGKCNLIVGPTSCCAWHEAVATMKMTLDQFEGFSCARNFKAKGDWQCAKCLSLEITQENGETGPGEDVQACSVCSCESRVKKERSSVSL